MAGPHGGTGGVGPPQQHQQQPDQISVDPAWAGHGVSGGTPLRPFSQIILEESATRNIIQLRLTKIPTHVNGKSTLPKNLNFDDFGEFLFDILKIKPEDCLGLDLTTGRYDTRELKFKPEIDVTPFLTTTQPYTFKSHEIAIQKVLKNVTRVTFKNVPMSVPDEEILHICKAYSTPIDNTVHREMVRLTGPNARRVVTGSTRYVDVNLNDKTHFKNFYWLEGPLPGDSGRRITVLYNGQPQQCSYCLKLSSSGCKAGGNGKICESLGTQRAKMSSYMESLKLSDNYVSLKSKYLEQQSKSFPSLGRKAGPQLNGQAESMDRVDGETEAEDEVLPVSPVEERDNQISALQKTLNDLQEQVKDVNVLKEKLTKTKAENNSFRKLSSQLTQKLNLTRKTNEIKLAEMICSGSTEDTPHLVTAYTATLSEDDFDLDITKNEITPKHATFLKNVEDKCDLKDEGQKERYCEIRNQVLDRVKRLMTTSPSHMRRLSVSSTASRTSKRDWFGSDEEEDNPTSKLRLKSPSKQE